MRKAGFVGWAYREAIAKNKDGLAENRHCRAEKSKNLVALLHTIWNLKQYGGGASVFFALAARIGRTYRLSSL